MKFILFALLCFSANSAGAASLLSASNISSEKVALTLSTGDEKNPRELLLFQLRDKKAKTLPWPTKIEDEEIMGLMLFPKSLYLISQWTAGGGKFPHVHRFDFSTQKWDLIGEVKCRSFDTVKISKRKIQFDCEEDSRTNEKAGEKSLTLTQRESLLSLVLPISKDEKADLGFTLNGSMFSWDSIELRSGKNKKTLSATELLQLK